MPVVETRFCVARQQTCDIDWLLLLTRSICCDYEIVSPRVYLQWCVKVWKQMIIINLWFRILNMDDVMQLILASYAAFTPEHMLSHRYIYPGRATCIRIHICRRIHVDGYKLLVWDTCRLYVGDIITIHLCHGRLVSVCIQQQTGDKLATILSPIYKIHVDGDKWIQVDTTCIRHRVS